MSNMSQEQINFQLNKKQVEMLQRKESIKLKNLNDAKNIKLKDTLEPNELSFLIQPEKPSIYTRNVPMFSDNSLKNT